MLLAALLLAQLLFYSIPLVLVKKPFFTLVVEWVASIQYRGVSLLLLLVPAALPSHSQTCVLVFYLQICILRSLITLGIAITWVRVFPLQKHATLINSLLVNASVLLLSFPATLHFLLLLFRDALDSTALATLLLRFERGRFVSFLTDRAVIQFVFAALIVASLLAVGVQGLTKSRYKRRAGNEDEETVVVGEDESREGVWDRWMRALRVKSSKEEDWNKQLQVEWARLCMLIEELCVCVSCVCEGRVRVAFVRGSDLSSVDKQQS